MKAEEVEVGVECVLNSGGHRMTIVTVTPYAIILMYSTKEGYEKLELSLSSAPALIKLDRSALSDGGGLWG